MNSHVLSDGKRERLRAGAQRSCRLVALTILLSGSAPLAIAQEPDIVGALTEGVRCFSPNAREDLEFNIKKLEPNNGAIGVALNVVAADEKRCAPMREAATQLSVRYLAPVAPTDEEVVNASSRAIVEQTLAEAERKAASLKFEVGPPPPRMTKQRDTGP